MSCPDLTFQQLFEPSQASVPPQRPQDESQDTGHNQHVNDNQHRSGQKLDQNSRLERDQQHTPDRPVFNFDQNLRRPDLLKRHKRTHDPKRAHICPFCKNSHSRYDNLKRHILRHTGQKGGKAKYCPKAIQV